MTQHHVGIDIGKHSLHVAKAEDGDVLQLTHDAQGLSTLLQHLEPDSLVVLEVSGGYEQDVLHALHQHGIACINPKQARDFARARGTRAKTDNVDARMLADFAKRMQPTPQAPLKPLQIKLKQMQRRLQTTRRSVAVRSWHRIRLRLHPALRAPRARPSLPQTNRRSCRRRPF